MKDVLNTYEAAKFSQKMPSTEDYFANWIYNPRHETRYNDTDPNGTGLCAADNGLVCFVVIFISSLSFFVVILLTIGIFHHYRNIRVNERRQRLRNKRKQSASVLAHEVTSEQIYEDIVVATRGQNPTTHI